MPKDRQTVKLKKIRDGRRRKSLLMHRELSVQKVC